MTTDTVREAFNVWWRGAIHPGMSPNDEVTAWRGWEACASATSRSPRLTEMLVDGGMTCAKLGKPGLVHGPVKLQ